MAQCHVRHVVGARVILYRLLSAWAKNGTVADQYATRAQSRIEVFECARRGFVECQIEMHEGPPRRWHLREHIRNPAFENPRSRKFAEIPAHITRLDVGSARRKERLHRRLSRSVP